MTILEKIYKELAERFKDEPNKNMILGYTMGVLEKNKAALVEEQVKILRKAFVSGQLAVDECKCIRFTGGDKWYPNGCKIHPNG